MAVVVWGMQVDIHVVLVTARRRSGAVVVVREKAEVGTSAVARGRDWAPARANASRRVSHWTATFPFTSTGSSAVRNEL